MKTKDELLPLFMRPGNHPVARERPSRWLVAVRAMMAKLPPGEVRQPTRTEIADLALGLAREKFPFLNTDAAMRELFFWPPWAEPCRDARCLFQPHVDACRKKAEEMLRQHFAYYHAMALRRRRWRRAHPQPRAWTWTKQPLQHAVPPPRRRKYRPPDMACPDASPPPPLPDRAADPPGEVLLCFSVLFDNEIAVLRTPAEGFPGAGRIFASFLLRLPA